MCYSWMPALEAIRTLIEAGSLLVAVLQLIAGRERVPPPPGNQFLYTHRRVMCTFCSVIQSSQRMIRMLLSEYGGGAGPSRVTQGAGAGHTKLTVEHSAAISMAGN
ncbi:unnamed protein product [Sphagnum jensenii]|uniref:Secreted protein n=1 Tax=Sphagnum jensenii TaxID=128206 RepID=A0ABP1B748_9BRYO